MNSFHNAYSEKRDFIRMRVDTPAKVQVQGESIDQEGLCKDLSGKGMLIELTQPISLGTELIVTVQSSHGHSPMIKARCIVMRVEPPEEGSDRTCVGVNIEELIKS
ncbi:PilZ domain-containing protein [Marinibactrum halimedae]|uniref:PilZ domain-containing protein n=1 Tax=Marinibactrum halimedae TaxID=1444977 RepID=A0AA37T867_9GAMM|nr:PilZ domain-containing protein [Marinibactrum halimedae]MCD9460769.1 PilZ domain-containing protein [Marinibactrum halimedae]GLS26657.1 PilZ domain-containing protein [Marinibactrum halimedae]